MNILSAVDIVLPLDGAILPLQVKRPFMMRAAQLKHRFMIERGL
jgi:hypothetical protein